MENEIGEHSAPDTGLVELGVILGTSQAFGLVAGRCSAAQAETLRKLREERKYLSLASTWKEFCPQYLGMSSSQADRIIALLDEFGPGYFELSQLTRISADTYRAVEPVIQDRALHFQGEIITFDAENARKVSAAVAALRREAAVKPRSHEHSLQPSLADIDKRFEQIIRDIEHMLSAGGDNWKMLSESVDRMGRQLTRLIKENKL